MRVINIKDLQQTEGLNDSDTLLVKSEETAKVTSMKEMKNYLFDGMENIDITLDEVTADEDIVTGNTLRTMLSKIRTSVKSFRNRITKNEQNLSALSNIVSSNKTELTNAINTAKTESTTYTDNKVTALVNGATTGYDTLKEIESVIKSNKSTTDTAIATAKSDSIAHTDTVITALKNGASSGYGTLKEIEDVVKNNKTIADAHVSNKNNPHSVTKEQVGLGNVPNVATNDQIITYSNTNTLATLNSGEKISAAFGKIKLAISTLINHIGNKTNPHAVTKDQLNLGNVDNTADKNKPVSTAQQNAIDAAYENANAYTDAAIGNLIGTADETMNTLGELGNLLKENEDAVDALNTAIGSKASQSELDTHTKNGTIHVTQSDKNVLADVNNKKHEHSNKEVLEQITQDTLDHADDSYSHISDSTVHLSSAEKTKLSSVETGANKYVLPVASTTVLGGVKVDGDTIYVDSENILHCRSSEETSNGGDADTVNGHTVESDVPANAKFTDTTYTSLKNPYALTIQGNGTTLTNGTYDGSAAKTVNITPSSIGAAASSHGTHVTFSTTAPAANGTASAGTATSVARSDHVHPLQTTVSGNAGSATKWATARNINGMSVQGDTNRVNYGTCSTAAATVAKTVACTGFALITGAEITVKFTVTNTASSPTLNVNSTGAKAIYYRGAAISAGYLAANRTYTFRYNGTQYELVGDINTDTNTVYTHPSSGVTAGTYEKVTVNAQGHVTGGSNPTYVHAAGGTAGTTGYVIIALITVTGTYQNEPIIIELSRRNGGVTSTLYIAFASANSTDPALGTFYYVGANYNCYLYKNNTSCWSLYVQKSEAYDDIGVVRYHKPAYMSGVSVAWTNSHAGSVPSGAVIATLGGNILSANTLSGLTASITELNYVDGVTSNIQTQLNGKAASSHTHSYLPLSGGTVTGTTVFSKATDLSGTANNSPALIIGGAVTSTHIEIDANEIQAKTNGTSAAPLYINNDGGLVTIGSGGLAVTGSISEGGTTLSSKYAAASHGTHVSFTTTTPKANGTASVGTASTVSRSDHVHPLQTSVTGSSGSCTGNAATATKATQDGSGNVITSTYALKSKYDNTTINVGRKADTAVGGYSVAEGYGTTASGSYSHAEGYNCRATGDEGSHAEGYGTTASGNRSHAEGGSCQASGTASHAEGGNCKASGNRSHAEGNFTTASGFCSHAEGSWTTALQNQHVQGHYNNATTATQNNGAGTSTGTAFVIGNGTTSAAANAFRVTGQGKVYATNATITAGADYAEFFEWADDNPNSEDRVGYFVTFDENEPEKIRIANEGEYILGIVSGLPTLIGNGDEDWKARYVLDDFGRYIEETFEYEEEDENGETVTKTGTKWKENPDYDKTKEYIPRDQRPEWSAVGMLGVLSVFDDGTCKVNGYCKCTDGGIATATEKRGYEAYRVIKRISDNIVKVVVI